MGKRHTFGINVGKYIKAHEAEIEAALAAQNPIQTASMLGLHLEKIRWLQHERLIHLIVTSLTGLFFMFALGLLLFGMYNPAVCVLCLIAFVLFTAYLLHYFKLENTVQHWYTLYDVLYKQQSEQTNKSR